MKTIHKFLKITGLTFFIMIVLCVFTILRAMFGIFYDEMTHLSKEDLQWIEGAKNHPTATFISNLGHISKLNVNVDDISIYNSRNPFYLSTANSKNYEANAWYQYYVTDSTRTLSGRLGVCRKINRETLSARYSFGTMFTKSEDYQSIYTQQFSLKDRVFDNCIVVDSLIAENSPYWKEKPLQQMDKFVISKDYGLIYYKLKDGEEFFRQFDEP